jgi:hypothetical protein
MEFYSSESFQISLNVSGAVVLEKKIFKDVTNINTRKMFYY